MRRRSGVLSLVGLVAIIVLAFSVSAGAAPSGGVQKQQTKVEAAQARLAELQGQTGAAYEAYNNALFELNQLDDKIASTKKSRASAQKDVDSARKSLQAQAARMYKSGNVGFVDVIVGARSFSEFTGRLNLWISLLEQDRAKLVQVREARNNLAQKEKALESQRKQRVATLDGAISDKENAAKLQSQSQGYLDSLGKNLAQTIRADQARRAEQARQDAARAAANVQAAPSVAVAQPIQVPELVKAATPKTSSAPQPAPVPRTTSVPGTTLSPQTASTARPVTAPKVKPAVVATKVDNSAAIDKTNRLARLAAQQAEAKKKAADQATARRKAAEKEAAKIAATKQANAEQAAAAEKAQRDAEAAAQRAAVEKAAADRKAAEQEAAKQAAERAAERAAVRRDQLAARKAAAAEQAAKQQTLTQNTVSEQQPSTAPLPATTQATVPQETTAPPGTTQAAVAPPPQTTPSTTTPSTTTEAPVPQPAAPPPSSGSGSAVVAEAQTWLGVPYVWGGASRSGVDCSGLTMLVFAQFGISLPHSAAAQDGYGSPGSGAAGDLVFGDFQGAGTITHVGIATGDGQMINAPYPGTVVRYDPIYPQYTLDYRALI